VPEHAYAEQWDVAGLKDELKRVLGLDLPVDEWAKEEGIADEELVVHYQPLARAADGEVCGFEALVRWKHPTRGMIPPLEFIPVAEENGLIGPLGDWVLRRACADAASWEKPLRIAVNLSPIQLHNPALPSLVHEVLITSGLSPSRLELEITESALFKDYQRALDNLRRLKALGVRIAMDDFGTGYSSLAYLARLPLDAIKLDKSFVRGVNFNPVSQSLVRAIVAAAEALAFRVIAEGVETESENHFLDEVGVDEKQGFLFARPMLPEQLEHWLQSYRPRSPSA
jgi:EAL domain-containing protein (putative c-di-GMP-specific phosphodiesterase class I)